MSSSDDEMPLEVRHSDMKEVIGNEERLQRHAAEVLESKLKDKRKFYAKRVQESAQAKKKRMLSTQHFDEEESLPLSILEDVDDVDGQGFFSEEFEDESEEPLNTKTVFDEDEEEERLQIKVLDGVKSKVDREATTFLRQQLFGGRHKRAPIKAMTKSV